MTIGKLIKIIDEIKAYEDFLLTKEDSDDYRRVSERIGMLESIEITTNKEDDEYV